jgi:hypothetical protein
LRVSVGANDCRGRHVDFNQAGARKVCFNMVTIHAWISGEDDSAGEFSNGVPERRRGVEVDAVESFAKVLEVKIVDIKTLREGGSLGEKIAD